MAIDCQHVHSALRRGDALDEPAVAGHVAECASCTVLVDGGAPMARALDAEGASLEFDAMFAELEASVEKERGPVAWLRSMPTAWRSVLAVLGAALVPVLVALVWGRVDRDVYPTERWALDLAILAGPIGLALLAVMRPLHRSAWPRWVQPAVVLASVLALLALPLIGPPHHAHPSSVVGAGEDLVPRAMVCMSLGTILGLPMMLWLAVLLRRGTGWSRPLMLAAVCAASVGSIAIFMHCPIVTPEHLLLGHATIVLPFLLLAAVRGR